ncbi:MAG: response regulator [Pseudomonadales bacterium]|nr:response regulator [Pseudomonadales bacterium]
MKGAKPTILSIDDEALNQRLIKAALHKRYHLIFASDGLEALQILIKTNPDIVLMDINMPEQNGFLLCEDIRTQYSQMALPILFISAEDSLDMRVKSYESAGNDYLCKPVNITELISKIEVLLGSRNKYQAIQDSLLLSRKAIFSAASINAEQASIIEFTNTSFDCENLEELAKAFFTLCATFGLQTSVQFRLSNKTKTFSSLGTTLPIEEQLLEKAHDSLLGHDSLPSKAGSEIFACDCVSVLVDNLPIDDVSFNERIRNHIKLALKACDSRVHSLYEMRSY